MPFKEVGDQLLYTLYLRNQLNQQEIIIFFPD